MILKRKNEGEVLREGHVLPRAEKSKWGNKGLESNQDRYGAFRHHGKKKRGNYGERRKEA